MCWDGYKPIVLSEKKSSAELYFPVINRLERDDENKGNYRSRFLMIYYIFFFWLLGNIYRISWIVCPVVIHHGYSVVIV